MKIDLKKWNQKRLETEKELRDLKTSIREGGERPSLAWTGTKYEPKVIYFAPGMGQQRDYQRIEILKLTATQLYQLRAHLRNRQHVHRTVTYDGAGNRTETQYCMDDQKLVAAALLPEYLLPRLEAAEAAT